MIRAVLRRLAGRGTSAKLLVLAYHKLLPDDHGSGFRGTLESEFAAQLEWIRTHFDVLPLQEGIAACRAGRIVRPSVCITFDDGYALQRSIGAGALERAGLPATFFITSGHLGDRILWNDLLYLFARGAGPREWTDLAAQLPRPASDRRGSPLESLESAIKYLPIAEREPVLGYLRERIGDPPTEPLMMSHADVRDLAVRGFDIGAHTVSHPILRLESPDVARSQMEDDVEAVSRIIARPVRAFAFPNGKPGTDYDGGHPVVLARCGIDVALTSALGHFAPGRDPLQVARVALDGVARHSFLRAVRRAYHAGNLITESRGYETSR